MKHIAIITASRADAGIYIPVVNTLQNAGLDVHTIVSGNKPPDIVIVLGDTMPMLQSAIWAAENNITLAHIHGGDRTGSIDNKIRDAITAFADWHFPSLPAHAERLKGMGIPENRIRVVGPLGIYAMKDAEFLSEKQIREELGLLPRPIILVIQHPVSTEREQAGSQMWETILAVNAFKDTHEVVIIYPNNESGSQAMIDVIEQSGYPRFKNLPYLTFVSLLKYSAVIVGNSSCGLVEAPMFGVPCVNVGTRQNGRQRGVRTCDMGYNSNAIRVAIHLCLTEPRWGDYRKGTYNVSNPYALDIDGPEVIRKTIVEEM